MKAPAIAMAAALGLLCLGVLVAEQQEQGQQQPNQARATQQVNTQGNLAEQVELPKFGMAVMVPTQGNEVYGIVSMQESDDGLQLKGKIIGLTPGLHGFHIHEFGDLSDRSGKSAGDHFNPTGGKHGPPGSEDSHAGDLGNVEANHDGVAMVDIKAKNLKLHFILGRSLVVHEKADDLESQPSGDAGGRLAVGVIGVASPELSGKFLEQFETTQTSTRVDEKHGLQPKQDQQFEQQRKQLEKRQQELQQELKQLKQQQEDLKKPQADNQQEDLEAKQKQLQEQQSRLEKEQQQIEQLQRRLEQQQKQIEQQKKQIERPLPGGRQPQSNQPNQQ